MFVEGASETFHHASETYCAIEKILQQPMYIRYQIYAKQNYRVFNVLF